MSKVHLHKLLLGSSALAAVSLAGAMIAAPAQAAGAAAADKDNSVAEVVVTGSRIPKAGFDTLQPAQTISAASLGDRAVTNVGDALNELSAFGPAGSNNTGQQSGSNVGQQFVNLYNLGAQRTLVLVNGRRFVSGNAPTPPGTFGGPPPGQEVDLNDIPAGLIDHVEVLSVGGAPVYGADAIAGTVNIILKKNFQGVQAEAQYRTATTESGGASYVGRVLAGANFAEDRGNVTATVEYTQQDGLTYHDRKDLPFATFQPSDTCTAAGFHACYVPNATVASIFPGGIPAINAGLANSGGPSFPNAIHNSAGQVVAFARDGTLQPVNLGIQNNGLVFAQGGNGDDLSTQFSFIAPLKRTLIDTLAHYDFTSHIEGYLETEYSHSDGTQVANQPRYQSAFFASQKGAAPLKFDLSNPFLSAQARGVLAAALGPGNSTFFVSRANLDLAPQTIDNSIDTYRVVAGFKGDFELASRKIDWDASFNYGRSEGHLAYFDLNEANFENAIDVVTNPANGQVVCRVTLNPPPPPPGGQPASVTGCQPLNLFGAGAPSAAAQKFVTVRDTAESILTQRDTQVNVTGSPFDIWAGPLKMAAGFEYREESGSYTVDPFAQAGLGRNAPSSDVAGSYNSKEFYAEAEVPLISRQMNIPFVESAEFDGSYRRISNSLAGTANVFTLGLKYTPVADVQFRGNLTHSVRAPSIEELFLPTTNTQSFAQDPCDTNFITANATRQANCAKVFQALGVPLTGFKSNVVNASVLGTTGGNPDLLNEHANAWTAGLIARPRWVPGLTIALDWINIHLKDPITALTLTQTMDACFDTPTFPNNFCNLFQRDKNGQVSNFSTPLANAGAQEFAGANLQASYTTAVGDLPFISHVGLSPSGDYGNLTVDLNGFFEEKHNFQILGVTTKTRGNIGDSKWRFNVSERWRKGPLMVYLNTRYVSEGDFNVTLARNSQSVMSVGSYFVTNGAVSYDINEKVTGEVVVSNLFNQNPPKYAITLAGGAALSTYDYFGQAVTFLLKARF